MRLPREKQVAKQHNTYRARQRRNVCFCMLCCTMVAARTDGTQPPRHHFLALLSLSVTTITETQPRPPAITHHPTIHHPQTHQPPRPITHHHLPLQPRPPNPRPPISEPPSSAPPRPAAPRPPRVHVLAQGGAAGQGAA